MELFEEAISTSKIIGYVKGGDVIKIIKDEFSYYLVETSDGQKGYVSVYETEKSSSPTMSQFDNTPALNSNENTENTPFAIVEVCSHFPGL